MEGSRAQWAHPGPLRYRAPLAAAVGSLLPLLVAAAPAAQAAVGAPAGGSLADLSPAARFVSPVGHPEDFTQPAPGETHGYALTRGIERRRRGRHLGLDLSNRTGGGEVRAPADGIVLEAGRRGGWGQLVVIAHRLPGGDVVLSLLAHLKPGSVSVKPGQRVAAGQPVGAVGRSGRASAPHLHLELRRLEEANPLRILWERAPEVDPLRILGARLAKALPAPPAEKDAADAGHWARGYLRRLAASRARAEGDPGALLERREFYTWLARLADRRLPSRPRWSAVRRALEHRGLGGVPRARAALSVPIGREEAAGALSHLLTGDLLPGLPREERVPPELLRRHRLPAPTPMLAAEAGVVTGPERPLSRAEGALLVMAARSWAGASERQP